MFDPERWIDPDTPTLRHASSLEHSFQFLPFSAGRRNCFGQQVALPGAKLILATTVRRLEWGLHKGTGSDSRWCARPQLPSV